MKYLEVKKVIARVNRNDIAYINHIIESYDGVMLMTTLDASEAKVEFNVSPFLYEEALTILRELSRETPIEILQRDKSEPDK